MTQLPNDCRVGKFSVHPENWKTIRANMKLQWRISYWFYDDKRLERKKVVIKSGLNKLDTLLKSRKQ